MTPSEVQQDALARLYPPRLTGRAGRLEVWYATLTDPVTGTGIWIHHEVVNPVDGGPGRAHGWISVFVPGRAQESVREHESIVQLIEDGAPLGEIEMAARRHRSATLDAYLTHEHPDETLGLPAL